jgi:hypothetical protein
MLVTIRARLGVLPTSDVARLYKVGTPEFFAPRSSRRAASSGVHTEGAKLF